MAFSSCCSSALARSQDCRTWWSRRTSSPCAAGSVEWEKSPQALQASWATPPVERGQRRALGRQREERTAGHG